MESKINVRENEGLQPENVLMETNTSDSEKPCPSYDKGEKIAPENNDNIQFSRNEDSLDSGRETDANEDGSKTEKSFERKDLGNEKSDDCKASESSCKADDQTLERDKSHDESSSFSYSTSFEEPAEVPETKETKVTESPSVEVHDVQAENRESPGIAFEKKDATASYISEDKNEAEDKEGSVYTADSNVDKLNDHIYEEEKERLEKNNTEMVNPNDGDTRCRDNQPQIDISKDNNRVELEESVSPKPGLPLKQTNAINASENLHEQENTEDTLIIKDDDKIPLDTDETITESNKKENDDHNHENLTVDIQQTTHETVLTENAEKPSENNQIGLSEDGTDDYNQVQGNTNGSLMLEEKPTNMENIPQNDQSGYVEGKDKSSSEANAEETSVDDNRKSEVEVSGKGEVHSEGDNIKAEDKKNDIPTRPNDDKERKGEENIEGEQMAKELEQEEKKSHEDQMRKKKEEEEEERKKKVEEEKQRQLEEASLMNQNAEKEAFRQLMEENVRLQAEFDKLQKSFEEMKQLEQENPEMVRLMEDNKEKTDYILRLEEDISHLRNQMRQGSAGSADDQEARIRNLQQKLNLLAKEDEEKDKKIQNLNQELKSTKVEIAKKDAKLAELGANDSGRNPPSKSCAIL